MTAKLTAFIMMTILFVSQSFAFNSMNCQQHLGTSEQSTLHKMPNELTSVPGQMRVSLVGASELPDTMPVMNMDCCDTEECSCPVGACQSVGLISLHLNTSAKINAERVFFPLFAVSEPVTTNLKKPPIVG